MPLHSKPVIAIISGSSLIDLATMTDRISVEAVEYPVGQSPVQYCQFSLWGDRLTLLGPNIPDGSDCNIYYNMLHTLDAQSSTIPAAYEELVAVGACGYAAAAWALYAMNRVNNGGEKTPESFSAWAQDKLKMFPL